MLELFNEGDAFYCLALGCFLSDNGVVKKFVFPVVATLCLSLTPVSSFADDSGQNVESVCAESVSAKKPCVVDVKNLSEVELRALVSGTPLSDDEHLGKWGVGEGEHRVGFRSRRFSVF